MNNKQKLTYLQKHKQTLEIFRNILAYKEFNIYVFVSIFNPLINTLLTLILIFTDNVKLISILVAVFNILITFYLSVHKYYLTNEIPLENRILINNSNYMLKNLNKLEELYQLNENYSLADFQDDLYQDCYNLESEIKQYITPKNKEIF